MGIIIDLFFLAIHNPSFSTGATGFKTLGAKILLPLFEVCIGWEDRAHQL